MTEYSEEKEDELVRDLLNEDQDKADVQNEILFCAYVKLKLSTKEIAQISGIGVKAVQMYKYRLKKKFYLDKGTNFDKFLYAIGDSVYSTEVLPITK